jgi:hypothetical protein
MKVESVQPALPRHIFQITLSALVSAVVTICLAIVTFVAVSQIWLSGPQTAIGSTMKVCVQAGAGRVGVMMFSPHISAYEPPTSASCVYIPWSKQFPLWAHRWWFPP